VFGHDPTYRAGRRRLTLVITIGAIASAVALGVSLSEPDSSANPPAPCPNVRPAPPRQPTGFIIGVNSAWNRACDLAALASAGVSWERIEVKWDTIEPRRGKFRWGGYDKQFEAAARAGVTMLPHILETPRWAGRAWNALPRNNGTYARAVARLARRYGPHGSFWRAHKTLPYLPIGWVEIWNEPYLAQFSAGGPHPRAYARLVKASARAVRRVKPGVRIMLAADTSAVQANGAYTPWLGPMYAAVPHLNRYFDAVSVHPYTGPGGPDVYTPGQGTRGQFRRIQELHASFIARGASNKPFWITEVGWSTCPSNSSSCVSPATQAAYTARVFQIVGTEYSGWVRAVFLYNYRDSFLNDATNKEYWFGLLNHDGTPKPVWNVIRSATSAGA
jgi:polysaccharide biosynthesis protein PslG